MKNYITTFLQYIFQLPPSGIFSVWRVTSQRHRLDVIHTCQNISFFLYYFLQDIKLLILDYAMICSAKVPWNLNLLQNKQWQIKDLPVGANPRGRASHAPPFDPLPLVSDAVIRFMCNPEINCASRLSDDLSTRADVNHRFRSFLNTHFLTFSNW